MSPEKPCTVPSAKTTKLSKFYSLDHILAILHGMDTRYISKISSARSDNSDIMSCDNHVTQMSVVLRPFQKTVRLINPTKERVKE